MCNRRHLEPNTHHHSHNLGCTPLQQTCGHVHGVSSTVWQRHRTIDYPHSIKAQAGECSLITYFQTSCVCHFRRLAIVVGKCFENIEASPRGLLCKVQSTEGHRSPAQTTHAIKTTAAKHRFGLGTAADRSISSEDAAGSAGRR